MSARSFGELVDQAVDLCHVEGRQLVFAGELFAQLLDFAQPFAADRGMLLEHGTQRLTLSIVEVEIVRHRLQPPGRGAAAARRASNGGGAIQLR